MFGVIVEGGAGLLEWEGVISSESPQMLTVTVMLRHETTEDIAVFLLIPFGDGLSLNIGEDILGEASDNTVMEGFDPIFGIDGFFNDGRDGIAMLVE